MRLVFVPFCILVALTIILSADNAYGQRELAGSADSTFGSANSGSSRNRVTNRDLTYEEELDRMRAQGELDPASQRKLFIIEDLKSMDNASGKLLDALKKHDKDYLKDVASLAEKVAKASNSLRQKLTTKGKPEKVEALSITGEQLQTQANAMDEIVLDVVDAKPANIKKDDTVKLEEVCKRLAKIESQALAIRDVAKNKK